MADIQLIIQNLKTISNTDWPGRPQSRKSGAQRSFEELTGSAGQVANILEQNPNPSADSIENKSGQFGAMKNCVNYLGKTDGTERVLAAWSRASTEWENLVQDR